MIFHNRLVRCYEYNKQKNRQKSECYVFLFFPSCHFYPLFTPSLSHHSLRMTCFLYFYTLIVLNHPDSILIRQSFSEGIWPLVLGCVFVGLPPINLIDFSDGCGTMMTGPLHSYTD